MHAVYLTQVLKSGSPSIFFSEVGSVAGNFVSTVAEAGTGATVYDWLLEIIHVHCSSSDESEDGVELLLG